MTYPSAEKGMNESLGHYLEAGGGGEYLRKCIYFIIRLIDQGKKCKGIRTSRTIKLREDVAQQGERRQHKCPGATNSSTG